MQRLTAHGLTLLAVILDITSRETSEKIKWHPFPEQVGLWALMERYKRLIIAKPRKIGISLAAVLADLLWCIEHVKAGNRVRCVFAIDTDDKCEEHLDQAHDFLLQMHVRHRVVRSKGSRRIRFPGGVRMDFLTAGGSNPARGGQIHRLHATELPFWKTPRKSFQSMRSACADNAEVLIETTMDTCDPEGFTERLWDDARHGRNEYHAHFWSVESQQSYRLDKPITDEQWTMCKTHGFIDKRAASWWLNHALPNLAMGDMMRLMHDYPQCEDDLFAIGTGRVINRIPPPAVVVEHLMVDGVFGDRWGVEIYGEERLVEYVDRYGVKQKRLAVRAIEHSGQVVIAVDTAMGRRKTNSVVAAIDKRDRRYLACFWSNTVRYDDLGTIAANMRNHFSSRKNRVLGVMRDFDAEIVVEDDGVGDATTERLDRLSVPYVRFSQTGADKAKGDHAARKVGNQERCITATKRRVEGGLRAAPQLLRDEIKRFIKNPKGEYEGPKDCIMTTGIALTHIADHPYEQPTDHEANAERARRVYLEDRLREDRVQRGAQKPPWGT